jgi:hypothetical protein
MVKYIIYKVKLLLLSFVVEMSSYVTPYVQFSVQSGLGPVNI